MKTVANVFHKISYANRDDLTAGIICAGWDKRQGGQVLSIVMTCFEDIKPQIIIVFNKPVIHQARNKV